MYDTGCVYAVTERNVDGCGTDATEYVAAAGPLSRTEKEDFRRILESTKSAMSGEDWSTADFVERSVQAFNDTHATRLRVATDPVMGRICF